MKHLKVCLFIVWVMLAVGNPARGISMGAAGDIMQVGHYLSVSRTNLEFAGIDDTMTVDIFSDVAWEVNPPRWLTVTPLSGKGNGQIKIIVTENMDSIYSGVIYVCALSLGEREIKVTQYPIMSSSHLTVSPSNISFTNAGGTQDVDITANIGWSIKVSASWLSVSSSSGIGDKTFTVTAQPNYGDTVRDATITVRGIAFKERVINIVQNTRVPDSIPKAISITPKTLLIAPEDEYVLDVNFDPGDVTDRRVNWNTSDTCFATVSSTGVVKAKKKTGNVFITATSEAGEITDTCWVIIDLQDIIVQSRYETKQYGYIDLMLKAPSNEAMEGSFKVTLPLGLTLVPNLTTLSDELAAKHTLNINKITSYLWSIEITPKPGRRSGSSYQKVMSILYLIDNKMASGIYEANITDLNINLQDTELHKNIIKVELPYITQNDIVAEKTEIYNSGNALKIKIPNAEILKIYTVTGRLYKQQALSAGETTLTMPTGIYIVQAGDVVRKILIQ